MKLDFKKVASTTLWQVNQCQMCVDDAGVYDWSLICCRARFVTRLPGVYWRRGWMQRWKSSEGPRFYADIERAVKDLWKSKNANAGEKAGSA